MLNRFLVTMCMAISVMTFNILQMSQVSAQCEDLIVLEASVSEDTPYVGEQIVYTVRIENSTGSSPAPESPSFEGFWLAGSLDIRTSQVPGCNGSNGVTFNEKVLFPLLEGERVIPPGQLDFSSNPVYEASTTVISESVAVNVRPLPEGAPLTFTGAVGNFSVVVASVAEDALDEGDPITLRVAVEGNGNIDQIDPPVLSVPDEWRVYNQPSQSSVAVSDAQVYGGTKIFEWLLLPDVAGDVMIPAITFSYFNPDVAVYESIQTSAIPLTILPHTDDARSDANLALVAPVEDAAAFDWQLKPISGGATGNQPLSVWLLFVGPAIVVGAGFWRRYASWRAASVASQRRRDALKQARVRLADAVRMDGDAAYQAVLEAILNYLGDVWETEPFALDLREIQEGLIQADVSGRVVGELIRCMNVAQEGRYAPQAQTTVAPLARATLKVLSTINKALV